MYGSVQIDVMSVEIGNWMSGSVQIDVMSVEIGNWMYGSVRIDVMSVEIGIVFLHVDMVYVKNDKIKWIWCWLKLD